MSDIEVRSVERLAGSSTAYAYAVKAGPWIFLTGHEAFDFATGSVDAIAGPPGFPAFGPNRLRREGDFILRRMRDILQGFGSDLSNGVRLDQYYPSTKPVEPYHQSRKAEFGSYIPPSTSIVMERCFGGQTSISASLMAFAPTDGYAIERVYPAEVGAPSWSGFVPAISCNEFVFIAGQMATNPADGLDARAHVPDHARWGGSEIRKQTLFLIEHKLKPALEAAGSSLEQSLKAQVYLAHVDDIADFMTAWLEHFAEIPCAVTVVPAKSYGTVGGIIEINLIALKNDAARQKQVIDAGLPAMASYGPCVRAGELLFPSGLMAIAEDGYVAGASVSSGFAGLSHSGYTQAATIYQYVDALCKAAGTSIANVVRAQYFVSGITEFSGISAAWRERRHEQPHPFVCIQVPAPLPAPGATVMADFWIYVP